MRKRIFITGVIVFFCLLFFVYSQVAEEYKIKIKEPSDISSLVQGNNQFALELYLQLKDTNDVISSGGNLFFSPYSISTALAMTWSGARGKTERQISEVLHFPTEVPIDSDEKNKPYNKSSVQAYINNAFASL
ncbi:MAG: serpin family protein, partial [Planctomycetota bacterium]